jgi:hypothetical protein
MATALVEQPQALVDSDLRPGSYEQRLKRYGEHFETHRAVVETFDVTLYLSQLDERLRASPCWVSIDETICACLDAASCLCQPGTPVRILRHRLELGSHCKYMLTFSLEKDLRFTHKDVNKRLHIWTRTANSSNGGPPNATTKVSLLDVLPSVNLLHVYDKPEVSFELEDAVHCRHAQLEIVINYMCYDREDEDVGRLANHDDDDDDDGPDETSSRHR